MKKFNLKIIILFLVILLLPSFVMAEEVSSDITPKGAMIANFGLEKIELRNISYTGYISYYGENQGAIAVNGTLYNNYGRDVSVNIELSFYDKNKKPLDIITNQVEIKANNKTFYRVVTGEKDVNYKFDNIYYYSLKIISNDDLNLIEDSEKDLYVFENYNIKIKVNKNNIHNVEESFDLNFRKYVDTFSFSIPYRLKYTEEDGTKINKRVVMSNIKVSDDVSLRTEEGNRNLYVGGIDKDSNRKSYVINYNWNAFEDTINKQDEFVFYLVNNRDNKIDGLSFLIEFPDSIEEKDVYFMDEHGTILERVDYEVKGNTISGKFDFMINSNVSYAIKVVLKDNYFVNTEKNISSATLLTIFVSIIALTVTVVVWFAQKKRDNSAKYNHIYFNEKINSLELGYLYNGEVREKDIATLLINLANKGYINVEKNKKNYKIVKVKKYDSDDRVEKNFMKELFQSEDSVTRKDLINNVDCMKNNIEFKLQEHKKKNKLFVRPVLNYKLVFWFMIGLIFACSTINIFLEYQINAIPINIVVGIIGYIVLLYGILYENIKIEKVIYIFVGLMFIVAPIVLTEYQAFVVDKLKLITYIIGILSMLVIITISRMMNTRSFYGVKIFNKINAYRNYLIDFDDTTKELKNNKYCFYEVLPYTFVLGISDKWYEKFKDLDIVKPKWYIVDNFKLEDFYKDIKDIYADIFISLKNSNK